MGSYFRNYIDFFNSCFLILIIFFCAFSSASDRITSGQSLRDGETIISSGGKFTLGFFTPEGSNFRYVGIWYNRVANGSIVWTANAERPISGNSGVFAIENDGNLVVRNGSRSDVVWSSNLTFSSNTSSTAILMDSGNLVLFGTGNSNLVFWQSFDHPTDTYLPEMRVSFNVRDGERRVFTSWRTASDPSLGNFSMGIDPRGSPQIVVWEGVNRRWRSGHWNGLIFTGVPGVRAVFLFGFRLENEGGGNVSFRYTPSDNSDLIKFWMNWEGMARQELWNDDLGQWNVIQSHPAGECDRYNYCGSFARCDQMDETKCSCIEGFEPNDDDEWSRGNWSRGCRRRTDLQCTGGDGFVQIERVKLPDLVDYVGLDSARDCQRRCLENCSCTAYAFVSGINCLIWNHDLVDVQQFQEGGNALFVRLARSELGNNRNRVIRTIIITVATVGAFFLCVSIWILWRRITKWQAEILIRNENQIGPSGEFSMDFSGQTDLCAEGPQATGTELAMFSFDCVAAATDKFCHENKLGEGGFGHVYKGTLPCGQEIAVKRLSKKSGQGVEEFKNEIMVIAKLQHRNLVRLLGCCVQGEEKMILYEYMPNKSLDCYLFDSEKKARLDWSKRFNIIEGIARGLLYLHRDSRLRIIHRDLKASNILLDEEMNPKISDFGMARIFGGNQNEENTNRVVGTYGYMAPEYAMEGLFSLKSDVYSFGVLMLEIITGRRNISYRATGHSNIIGHAWDLFDRGKAIELVDPSILESCSQEQVLRCIHVGVLCAQDIATYRPDMPTVVLMLEHENTILPMPKQPTFTSMRHTIDAIVANDNQDVSSNNVTVSTIIGR